MPTNSIKKLLRRINYDLHKKNGLFFNRFEDEFYAFHQDKLRGSNEVIKKKQAVYLKHIKKVPKKTLKDYPFIDCGFGRGEFLELLTENNINAIGVDTSDTFIQEAQKKGYSVAKDDAIQYLYTHDHIYSGISAFHLVEHLHFYQLFDFLLIAKKKLTKKGILIIETPNIENIIVSTTTFNYDPTHVQKVTRELLQVILEFLEFKDITFLPLHPIKKQIDNEVEQIMFGPQDMGVVARV